MDARWLGRGTAMRPRCGCGGWAVVGGRRSGCAWMVAIKRSRIDASGVSAWARTWVGRGVVARLWRRRDSGLRALCGLPWERRGGAQCVMVGRGAHVAGSSIIAYIWFCPAKHCGEHDRMYSGTGNVARPNPPKQSGTSRPRNRCVASTAVTCFVAMALYMARGVPQGMGEERSQVPMAHNADNAERREIRTAHGRAPAARVRSRQHMPARERRQRALNLGPDLPSSGRCCTHWAEGASTSTSRNSGREQCACS